MPINVTVILGHEERWLIKMARDLRLLYVPPPMVPSLLLGRREHVHLMAMWCAGIPRRHDTHRQGAHFGSKIRRPQIAWPGCWTTCTLSRFQRG